MLFLPKHPISTLLLLDLKIDIDTLLANAYDKHSLHTGPLIDPSPARSTL